MAEFQEALDRLNESIERNIKMLNFPGLAIGITDHQQILFEGNYGFASLESQQPVTTDTLFQIGSISKAFTSIGLLLLQEQGLLDVDAPVTQYLPWFEVQSEYAPITLRHLMSHTAGIIMGTDDTLSAFTETWHLRHTKATTPPGEVFHYSNSGYKALGLVLQTLLNQSIADILAERILQPLGMVSTESVITNNARSRMATGYVAFHDDRPLPIGGKLAPGTWFELDTADGSISSNAPDMCRYLRAILNQGGGLLSSDSFEQLVHPLIPTGDGLHGEFYSLGLCVQQVDGHQVISHGGTMLGYSADLLADMDEGLGIVVLSNGPGDPETISQYALNLMRAARNGGEFPEFPMADPYRVSHCEDYVGRYRSANKEFTLTSKGEHLHLEYEGDSVLLEPRPQNGLVDPHPAFVVPRLAFVVPHPAFELFLLRFGRRSNPEHKEKNEVIEAFHGSDWYVNERYRGKTSFAIPAEWHAYTGHYRSHNPWLTNFRVLIQKGSLVLIHQVDAQETLYPAGPGSFRVGADHRSPEFLSFDTIIDGKAMRANLSGGVYCRFFTP